MPAKPDAGGGAAADSEAAGRFFRPRGCDGFAGFFSSVKIVVTVL
jgi:hypothetical protein